MKVLVALALFVAVAQASSLAGLEFAHRHAEPNPRHTADEWEAIYAAASDVKIDSAAGLVLGTTPQDENAGKVLTNPGSRIITGTAVSQGDIPWQAFLIMGGTNLCGGSLISSEWVLTAAHCLDGFNTFQITLGATSRTVAQSGTVSQAAREALIHANWDTNAISNDIGLLRLGSLVTFTNFINAVRLPRISQASVTFEGNAAVVSGFGRTSSILNIASSNLLYADLTIIGNTQCAATFGARILASNICTLGEGGRSPCNGDSGGPLVIREADGQYTLVGAVSFGVRNCPAGNPAAFVRVSSYLNWISANTGLALSPCTIKPNGDQHFNEIITMKFLVALTLFVAAAQAAAGDWRSLQFVHPEVEGNPRYTAEEWRDVYAAAEDFQPEDTAGLVPGTVPQPEDAGRVYTKPGSRIITGTAVSQGDIPWQAFIIMGGTSLCGGSLISSEWVLTAAHCLSGFSSFEVTLGATSRAVAQPGAITQEARQALIHGSYSQLLILNDIGLLRLSSVVAFNNIINAIRLPSLSDASKTYAGENAVVSGFGRTSSTTNTASANLLFADVSIITNAACANTFGIRLRASNICSLGTEGRSPCNGDSGGPLVIREADGQYTEVGIVSFGLQNCPAGNPAAFVRVTSYLNWISANSGLALRP
ncbi:transmembrane protease serine 9-like [Bacillus rossius redtenbacheri]|uniref:transmembrane protease serine 9-like n=1 Tax=Bacillus rossius redtenbacheri TaxID=93214 RepID=UPI002FDD5C72